MSPGGSEVTEVMATMLLEFHMSKLCEVYFGIFDSKCERAVFQHMSFPTASIVLRAFSLFRGDCLLSLILCSVVGG